jgi:tetratricopeptide (TPR) repeat protein
MTESLITSLSQIPDLSVKARSSVFRYKGKEVASSRIGLELGVQALLTGRLTPNKNGVTLRLELVDAKDETVLWADSFDKKLDDLVSLQKQIAEDVSKKLRTSLSPGAREKLAKAYTDDPAAHRAYLQGRFYWEKRNIKDFEKAKEYFERAIGLDPAYALAYVGLADTYGLIPTYDSGADPRKYMPLAREAAEKAIALDPQLAEAHASLGRVLFAYSWEFPASERSLKRALEINPGYATAHMWYSEFLAVTGDHAEELKEIRIALELEPFSLVFNRMLASSLANNGMWDEAIAHCRKTIELFPNDVTSRTDLSKYLAYAGKNQEAVGTALEAQQMGGMDEVWLEKMKEAGEKGGWTGYQRVLAEYGEEQKKTGYFSGFDLAVAYAFAGERDKALDALNRAYEERDSSLAYLRTVGAFKPLKDDPRFKEIVRKIGLPE